MLFLCDLPTDVEPTNKEKPIKTGNKKIGMLITTMVAILIIMSIAAITIAAKTKAPENVSPYCLYIRNEGKTCKIHHIKHEGQDLKELVISENEMAFHQKLYEEVSTGAYFDGKRIYREEDAAEILAIYDTYQKEKETLFEKYLEGALDEERTERYNIIIEELTDLEETIIKLNIEPADNNTLSRRELIEEIEELKKEIDAMKVAQLSSVTTISMRQDETQSERQDELQNVQQAEEKEQTQEPEISALQEARQDQQTQIDTLLYVAGSTQTVSIPIDIEKAATIKRSSLYQ